MTAGLVFVGPAQAWEYPRPTLREAVEEIDECFGYPTDLPLGAELVFVFFRQATLRDGVPFNTCLRKNGSAAAFVLNDEPDGSAHGTRRVARTGTRTPATCTARPTSPVSRRPGSRRW